MLAVRARKALNSGHGAGLRDLPRYANIGAVRGGVSAYLSCQVEHFQSAILEPLLAGPAMPVADTRGVT